MRVSWKVKQNPNGAYDIYKDDALLQIGVPPEKLEAAMDPHHVRGDNWKDLLKQLEAKSEGTVVIDPWPPGRFFV